VTRTDEASRAAVADLAETTPRVRIVRRVRAVRPTWFGVAFALVMLPFAVAGIDALVTPDGAFARDYALQELRIRDVGREPVAIGLYSRDGWSHPGPAFFYTLALPYRLLGSTSGSLLFGAAVVNAVAVGGSALVAKRLGGTAAGMTTLLAGTVLMRALGAEFLRDPWVCFASVLPFALFCMLVWATTSGVAWALPAAAALATWLTQTHVGFAPLTAPLVLLGAAWLWWTTRRAPRAPDDDAAPGRSRTSLRGPVITTVVVLALLWAPTVWDQLFRSGNFADLVDWFRHADDEPHTLVEAIRIVLAPFGFVPSWISGERHASRFNGETMLLHEWLWPVLLAPFVAAVAIAWKMRWHAIVRLAAVLGATVVVGVVAVGRTLGVMYEYRLLWTWVVGALGGVVVGWTLWQLATRRWPGVESKVLLPATVAGVAVLAAVQVVDIVRVERPEQYVPEVEAAAETVAAWLGDDPGQVVLRSPTSLGDWYKQGLILALEKRGIAARVQGDPEQRFLPHRVATDPDAPMLVVMGDGDVVRFADELDDLELVAYEGPMPLPERIDAGRRLGRRYAQVAERFHAGELTLEEFEAAWNALPDEPNPVVAVFYEPAP
jgi:hypothetical protein